MTETVFAQVLDMSLGAAAVILIVLVARFLLRKTPKIFSYALWFAVIFRLLCPAAIGIYVGDIISDAGSGTESKIYSVYQNTESDVAEDAVQTESSESRSPLELFVSVGGYVWAAGVLGMAVYSGVKYILLRKRLVGAVWLKDNIYTADHIAQPFALGIFRPKIFLPSGLSDREADCIIAHEKHHIKRLDHIVKPVFWAALCLHWFNPAVWLAFALFEKDMEMSCDEAVIKTLGEGIRADYSESLLKLATADRGFAKFPTAFGGGNTKERIRNMANWKKPRKGILIVAAIFCLFALAACSVEPKGTKETSNQNSNETICTDINCTDAYHGHDTVCTDSNCTDTSHGHDVVCNDTDCTDASHGHDVACNDADCTDTSHGHHTASNNTSGSTSGSHHVETHHNGKHHK